MHAHTHIDSPNSIDFHFLLYFSVNFSLLSISTLFNLWSYLNRLIFFKITEKINIESLNKYQIMEAEKKKAVLRKTAYGGPIISYHSTTISNEDGTKESRNFLTFSDTANFFRVSCGALSPYPFSRSHYISLFFPRRASVSCFIC